MLDCERDGWLPVKSLYSPPWDSIIAEDQLPSKGLYFPASLLRNGATWLVVNCGMWAEVPWVTFRPWFSKLGMVFMILFFLPPLDPKVEGNPGSHMMKLVQSWSALVPEWLCGAPMLDCYTSKRQIFRRIKQFGIWVCGLLKLNSGSQTLVHQNHWEAYSNTDCWPHLQNFRFSSSRLEPKNVHFSQVSRNADAAYPPS